MATLTPVEFLLAGLAKAYLWLVAKTARIKMENFDEIRDGQMIGYWHEDSQSLLALLGRWTDPPEDISVIVTADWRGNLLERLLGNRGTKAIRVADGAGIRHSYASLRAHCADAKKVMAGALDGPLGPRRVPKRLLFHLAGQYGKEMSVIRFDYRGVIRLRRRWDHYVLPMPFCRMTARVEVLGTITPANAKNIMAQLEARDGQMRD